MTQNRVNPQEEYCNNPEQEEFCNNPQNFLIIQSRNNSVTKQVFN